MICYLIISQISRYDAYNDILMINRIHMNRMFIIVVVIVTIIIIISFTFCIPGRCNYYLYLFVLLGWLNFILKEYITVMPTSGSAPQGPRLLLHDKITCTILGESSSMLHHIILCESNSI